MGRIGTSASALIDSTRRHHLLLAGVVDASVSSLATFIIGFYATRSLDPETLGGYALAFSVFVISGFIPAQLVFTPTEIAAVDYPENDQLSLLRQSLVRGAVISFAAAAATSIWFLVAPTEISRPDLAALVISCAAATFISPIQDHLRRMLHVARASWQAVFVAIVQISVALAAVVVLPAAGLPLAAVPFGALFFANTASLVIGLVAALHGILAPPHASTIGRERLLRSGGPLLATGLIPSLTTFVVAWMVSALAGAATLGYVEATRIVSQPVAVLQAGLGSVLGPRATRAASQRDVGASRVVSRVFRRMIVVAGAAWLLAVAAPVPWNPLTQILPTAYVIPGLVAAAILAYTIQSLSLGLRFELYGAGRESRVARAEAEGNIARIAVALGAGFIGAFVVPLGLATLGTIRLVRSRRWLREYYAEPRAGAAQGGERPNG